MAEVSGTTTTYANVPAGPLAQRSGTTVRYYLRDQHGDTVGLGTTSATLAGTALYDPWGQVLAGTGEMATAPAQGAFGFQSDLTDPATGQVDMLTRMYEPGLGRFLTRDVLFGNPADPISLNQFGYGGASPVTYSDPTGMRIEHGGSGGSVEEQTDSEEVSPPAILPVALASPIAAYKALLVPLVRAVSLAVEVTLRIDVVAENLFNRAFARIGRMDLAIELSERGWALRRSILGRLAPWARKLSGPTALLSVAASLQEGLEEGRGGAAAALRTAGGAGGALAGGELASQACVPLGLGPHACALTILIGVIAGGLGGEGLVDFFLPDPPMYGEMRQLARDSLSPIQKLDCYFGLIPC
jgi:RHS repeat-associated protein